MNVKQLAAAAVFAFAGTAAMAGEITVAEENFVATLSRAQVQAAVQQARATGAVFASEVDLSATRPQATTSTLTRADVQAELRKSPRARVSEFNVGA